MTVRAWVTIGVLCLVALGIAATVRILSPLEAPELIARAGDERLEAVFDGSCWPQRDETLRCVDPDEETTVPEGHPVPPSGAIRVIAAYPVQPREGTLDVLDRDTGEVVTTEAWGERLRYELEPGAYVLEVEARYPADGWVRYLFPFSVEEDRG